MDFVVAAPGQNVAVLHKLKPCYWEPIQNIDDPYVQEMGRFAVMEHTHHLCGVGMKFIRVVSGETKRALEGKEYRLLVEVQEEMVVPCGPSYIKMYVAFLLDKECDRSWKLLDFTPGPVVPDP